MKKFTCYLTLLLVSLVLTIASSEAATEITSLPYTINSPGSYYINRDLSSAGHGIIVNKNHVTIDLRGHTIKGSGTGTYYGIYMNGRTNVEIKNGTVRNFGSHGIFEVNSPPGSSHRVINIRAIGNHGDGIILGGTDHLVEGCTASFNTCNGIDTGYGCMIINNTAYNNGYDGIHTNSGCTISGNIVYNNGHSGISTGAGCSVKNNTAYYNQRYGISLSAYDLVDGNAACNNNQSAGGYSNISACGSCTFGTNSAP